METDYVDFGCYSPYETRQLLDAFVAAGIRFDAAVANRPPQASMTGRFGEAAGVAVSVHRDDAEKAMELRAVVFKVQV